MFPELELPAHLLMGRFFNGWDGDSVHEGEVTSVLVDPRQDKLSFTTNKGITVQLNRRSISWAWEGDNLRIVVPKMCLYVFYDAR